MVRMQTAADVDPKLAEAVGRFVQSSANLERAVRTAVIRLLPMADEVALAVLADNSVATNREILSRLLAMPSIPISDQWRADLIKALPQVKASHEDRNRLVHHIIVHSNDGFVAIVEKKGSSAALPVTAEQISSWADEAGQLAAEVGTVPYADYSGVKLEREWPRIPKKDWPKRPPRQP